MAERLLSVGLDVGTTSTQMIVSELEIQNLAGVFSVPQMQITRRTIRYQSPVYFTPLLSKDLVDGGKIREILETEYTAAGIRREDVDTGAVIITGETSRKENAAQVLTALAELAGDFVVATAGPALESILAAKGAGATEYSRQAGTNVLHMDIGGGTSNLSWIQAGKTVATGCLNVGGRLIKYSPDRRITYVSPVLEKLCKLSQGETVTASALEAVAVILVRALEMAAGLRERDGILDALWTAEAGAPHTQPGDWVLSFSGGVADCIDTSLPFDRFGDLGPVLGKCIRKSALCRGPYRLGSQTIRATVIGAGCHSAQLSGSTVYHANLRFPIKNRPVACISQAQQSSGTLARDLEALFAAYDTAPVLALPGKAGPDYAWVRRLAADIVTAFHGHNVAVAVEQDMAKALGQAMALLLPPEESVLCIDRVKLSADSFLDVAAPVGPCLPVVVKTLILNQ